MTHCVPPHTSANEPTDIMLFILFLVLTMDALIIVRHYTSRDAFVCSDYSPCVCEIYEPYGLVVHCGGAVDDKLPVTALDVWKVFNRTKVRHIYWLDLLSLATESESSDIIKIPADLLNGKSVDRIAINCTSIVGPLRLEIHPDAFRSSLHHIGHFEVAGCDLSRLGFEFLANSTRLISLSITRSINFRGFPPMAFLARLRSLRIYECLDFQHWNQIADRLPLLESLFLDGTQLGDRPVNKLVNSITSSPTGNETLQQLSLWENRLTRIPDGVSSFKKLSYVNFFGNAIRTIPKGSLAFSPDVRVAFLILSKNALTDIEPGAFQGDFSEALVYLDFNRLTRFDSAVYEDMLQQMSYVTSTAGLYVHNNPFVCDDCHLSWLIRDKRHLLKRVHNGRCSNGTLFENLNPQGYDHCLS
ncbi:hypothetical protein GHT06_019611 [Daphnia sinensis]|uniref:Uncharacterized protein n=1 Tax=Daphnia sinensis TaxID=1820382 RepID=A0AAD5PRK2_9CRUS|nr:hypothetical protein GHT06_019611 [Daphnia sinensis]